MLLSELISALERMKKNEGDIKVTVSDGKELREPDWAIVSSNYVVPFVIIHGSKEKPLS